LEESIMRDRRALAANAPPAPAKPAPPKPAPPKPAPPKPAPPKPAPPKPAPAKPYTGGFVPEMVSPVLEERTQLSSYPSPSRARTVFTPLVPKTPEPPRVEPEEDDEPPAEPGTAVDGRPASGAVEVFEFTQVTAPNPVATPDVDEQANTIMGPPPDGLEDVLADLQPSRREPSPPPPPRRPVPVRAQVTPPPRHQPAAPPVRKPAPRPAPPGPKRSR
jgi:hypothetical protein